MTNGDYIRSMTDEELAEVLNLCCYCSVYKHDECDAFCRVHIKEWLEQEREGVQE